MFDGNYRTSQRPVSLAGRRRKATTSTTPTNRAAILETSRRQREERSQREKQVKASVCIQRIIRGYLSRIKLIRKIERALVESAGCSFETHVHLLNARFIPTLMKTLTPDHAAINSHLEIMSSRITQGPTDGSIPPAPFLVQVAMMQVRAICSPTLSWLGPIVECFVFGSSSSIESTATLSKESLWRRIGWSRGYFELLDSLQFLVSQDSEQPTCYPHYVMTIATQILWRVLLACPLVDGNRAVVCAMVLSRAHLFDRSTEPDHQLNLSIIGGVSVIDMYQEWFSAFVSTLTKPADENLDQTLRRAVQGIFARNRTVILKNALDMYDSIKRPAVPDPSPLILLLDRCLSESPQLTLLSSLVAKGDDLQDALTTHAAKASDTRMLTDEDDESDDDSEEYGHSNSFGRPTSGQEQGGMTRNGTRLTRNELQTMSKLNRYYSLQVHKWQCEVFSELESSSPQEKKYVVELAKRIGQPGQWLSWGTVILSQQTVAEEVRVAYLKLMSYLLQTSTGLESRQSASNPLLTKVAFNQGFLEKLWSYVLMLMNHDDPTPTLYMAFSVFADAYSHCLIALRDDQFLSNYTSMSGSRVMLAEHIISSLRDMLFAMYWSRPVLQEDMKIPFVASQTVGDVIKALRGRLFLTGTKLWNSLYQRWCRLIRTSPFCSESTWIFPSMTTFPSDEAMPSQASRRVVDTSMDSGSDNDQDEPMSTVEEETEELADAFGDPKMARILTCIPQALPFEKRVRLFDSLLRRDKLKTQDETDMRAAMLNLMRGDDLTSGIREKVSVHRESLYEDAMRQLNSLGPKLRKKIQVTFINQLGAVEAGIDGGGVFKEFIDDLISDAFVGSNGSTATYRLFKATPLETLYVNSDLGFDPSLLDHYEFCGRVLGKAVYESILVEPQFCLPFLNQLLGRSNTLEDLKNFDPELYGNLMKLLASSQEEIEAMGLAFDLTVGTGRFIRVVELVKGGGSVSVTKDNVITYVHLVANQRLNVESAHATKAFLRGFRDVVPASWVRLFSAYELQKLISGDDSIKAIDVASFKAAMQYSAGYHPSQPIVQWFWEVVEELNGNQQRKLLKFMTSCSRQPLLGFSSMTPAPCIQQIRLHEDIFSQDAERVAPLPTSSTCANLLKLPNYRSKDLLRKKLLAAIESGAGFELT